MYHPSYPYAYKDNLDCYWTIRAPLNFRIKLEFRIFSLENSVDCQNDFIALYDGKRFVNSYCGNNIPPVFVSKENEIRIHIKTNEGVTSRGFLSRYSRVLPDTPSTESPKIG